MKRTIITWAVTLLLVSAAIVWAGWKASYTELAETPATDDFLLIVDLSDTTMAATGTTKWVSYDYLGVPDLVLLSGMAANSEHLGDFTGTTITSSSTIKTALQELETYAETKVGAANPVFSGTVELTTTNTIPTTGVIRPATATDADYFALAARNASGWQDVVRIVNDTGGVPEFQLQPGAAFTGLGTLTIEDTGIIRTETDTSDDYFRIQATDDVGGTPAQTDALKVTNAGTSAAPKIEIGNTLTATKVYLTATADTMADDEWNGIAVVGKTFGETVAQWGCVFLAADGKFDIADADAAGEFPAFGIAVAGGNDTDAATILVRGIVRNEGWTGLTVGGKVYLGDGGAGAITQTAPSSTGDCVQLIGIALSDSEIYFNFTGHYLEIE